MNASELAPLEVDELPLELTRAAGLAGRIGMTLAPGKRGAGTEGAWDRDLESDLRRLRSAYATDVLVCLLRDEELASLGIANLVAEGARHGIDVVRHPVRDGGVPDEMGAFSRAIDAALVAARDGRHVVVHCRAGRGRTGTFVACVLVALGHAPADALRYVRAARRGTVETSAQERWISDFAAWKRRPGR